MPIYSYQCPQGHIQEAIQPIGTEGIICGCGLRSSRLSVFDPLVITQRAKVPADQVRHDMRLFDEATEEMDYHHRKAEEGVGHSLKGPNLWLMAKYRARLIKAGLAPPPTGTR